MNEISKNKKLIKLGVVSFDDPKLDNTLLMLNSIQEGFGFELFTLNPQGSTGIGEPFDILWFRGGTCETVKQLNKSLRLYQKIPSKVKIDSMRGLKTSNDKIKQYRLLGKNKTETKAKRQDLLYTI